jgi:hypothetical protein
MKNAKIYDPNATTPLFLLEPHIAERLFLDSLISTKTTLISNVLGIDYVTLNNTSLISITTLNGLTYFGSYFIDASYEGDLLAASGVSVTIGRESKSFYGEKNAGRLGNNYSFLLPINPYNDNGSFLFRHMMYFVR